MPNPVTIRSIAPADYPLWLPLWEGCSASHGRTGAAALAPGVTETTWRRFFDGYEPVHALVAEAEPGRLLGLAHYLFHRSTSSVGPDCWLQDIFTAEPARGRGVGRALIAAVCERARHAGAGRVYWQARDDNAAARRLSDAAAEASGCATYRKLL